MPAASRSVWPKEIVRKFATKEVVAVQTVPGVDILEHNVNNIMESDSEEGFGDPEIADDAIENVLDKEKQNTMV